MGPRKECLRSILYTIEDIDSFKNEPFKQEFNIAGNDEYFKASKLLTELCEELIKEHNLVREKGHALQLDGAGKILKFSDPTHYLKVLDDCLQDIPRYGEKIISKLQSLKDNAVKADFSSHKDLCNFLQIASSILNESNIYNSNVQWIKDLDSKGLVYFSDEMSRTLPSIKVPLKRISSYREDFGDANTNVKEMEKYLSL